MRRPGRIADREHGYRPGMSSSFSDDQLQPDDTLDERGVDDVLDEGMSPPERPSREMAHGVTSADDAEGETLDERLEQEEPDPAAHIDHSAGGAGGRAPRRRGCGPHGRAGGRRRAHGTTHRARWDDSADDVGVDGAAASAEEAAVHTVQEDQP